MYTCVNVNRETPVIREAMTRTRAYAHVRFRLERHKTIAYLSPFIKAQIYDVLLVEATHRDGDYVARVLVLLALRDPPTRVQVRGEVQEGRLPVGAVANRDRVNYQRLQLRGGHLPQRVDGPAEGGVALVLPDGPIEHVAVIQGDRAPGLA